MALFKLSGIPLCKYCLTWPSRLKKLWGRFLSPTRPKVVQPWRKGQRGNLEAVRLWQFIGCHYSNPEAFSLLGIFLRRGGGSKTGPFFGSYREGDFSDPLEAGHWELLSLCRFLSCSHKAVCGTATRRKDNRWKKGFVFFLFVSGSQSDQDQTVGMSKQVFHLTTSHLLI